MDFNQNGLCSVAHNVDGKIPNIDDLHFDNRTCMCGKFIFVSQPCGCPNNPHDELKRKDNPNYVPVYG